RQSASPDASAEDLPPTRASGFFILVESAAELFRATRSVNRLDRGSAEREPRNRLLQHDSGGYPGIPDHGLGFFSDLQVLAFCAGGRCLSTFESGPRHSICDLYHASLRDFATRLLRRPRSARH